MSWSLLHLIAITTLCTISYLNNLFYDSTPNKFRRDLGELLLVFIIEGYKIIKMNKKEQRCMKKKYIVIFSYFSEL